MKQGGTRNRVGNNIQETKAHGNLEMKISEMGRQGQESETRRNRDEQRGDGDGLVLLDLKSPMDL